MRLAFREHEIELKSWDSEGEMKDLLSRCEAGSILLGENAEGEVVFTSTVVYLAGLGRRRMGIGICSEVHGIQPCLLLRPRAGDLVFGFNSEVAGVDVERAAVRYRIELESLFHRFVPLPGRAMTLTFHETGVVAITEGGERIWSYQTDVIENWSIDGDILRLQFMDDKPMELSIASGAPI